VTFLDEHPIAERVVEQRIRERIHDWVIHNRPDVAVEIRRCVMAGVMAHEDFWRESQRLYGDDA